MRVYKRTFADPTALGDNSIVAAPGAGKRIRLVAAHVKNNAGTANSVRWRSAANSKSSLKTLAANQEASWPFAPEGWLETNDNQALNLNLSAATSVGVDVIYEEVGG